MTGADAPTGTERPVLVVGSYPPAPTAGAAVTLETVRRLWADGARVEVAAPRAGAAPLQVVVAGPFAGRRLLNLQRVTGADRLVICAERDLPVPTSARPAPALPWLQRRTVTRLAAAMSSYRHVTLIVCGDLGVADASWQGLAAAADEVVIRSDARGTPGVSTLGPSETTPADLARRAAGVALRRIFGRRAPQVRAGIARTVHLGRRIRARLR